MNRRVGATITIALALGIILSIGIFLPIPGTDPRLADNGGPIYTVPQVQQGIARNPQAWAGRVIRLRAVLLGEPGQWLPSGMPTWGFAPAPTVALAQAIPAAWIPVNSRPLTLLQWLRIVPPPEPPAGFFPPPTTTPQIYEVHLVLQKIEAVRGSLSQQIFAEFYVPIAFV